MVKKKQIKKQVKKKQLKSKALVKKKAVAKKAMVKKVMAKKKAVTKKKVVAKKKAVKKAVTRKSVTKKTVSTSRKPAAKAGKGLGLTYITRMDHGNTHGWWVRVYKDSKPVESKLFSDGVHGGKLKAKKMAQDHRDLVVRKNKIVPVHLRKTREHSVDKRSTSGVVGVTLSVAEKAGSLRVHWSARFMEKGRQRNVSFSVRKYGYEGAFRNALKVRFSAIGRPVPRSLKPPTPSKMLERWMKKQNINPDVNRVTR